jgi:choline dehydrogenase
MPVSLALLEQRTRGQLYLRSADPHEPLRIDPRMLESSEDIQSVLSAMEFVAELVAGASLRRFYGPLLKPGRRSEWTKFARSTYDSYHHGCGTCKMGPTSDEMAVVDGRLRVHGIDNLWIADASVMPIVPHANTNLAAIMIGERLSDFIRDLK